MNHRIARLSPASTLAVLAVVAWVALAAAVSDKDLDLAVVASADMLVDQAPTVAALRSSSPT